MSEQVFLKNQTKISKPRLYAVIICNDDVTTMDFVVLILNKIFKKSLEESTKLMIEVHEKGQGLAGIYVLDIALTKKNQVDLLAMENNFPLKVLVLEV